MFFCDDDEKKERSRTGMRFCHPDEVSGISRRQMLKHGISLAGFMTAGQFMGVPAALSQTTSVQRRLVWIMMGGGWDILETVDPRPASTSGIEIMYQWNLANQIAGAADDLKVGRWMPNLAALGADMVVVRGLSMGTNSHTAGQVYMDTGVLSNSGNVNAASIPAIIASQSAATIPVIQLAGGMDVQTDRATNNVSVVRAQNLELYRSMYPENSAQLEQKLRIMNHLQASVARVQEATGTNDRLTAISTAQSKIRTQFESDVRSQLAVDAADLAPFTTGAPNSVNNNNANAFAMTAKLLKNNLVSAINLGIGGFDTHSNQQQRMQPIVESFDFLLSTLVNELRTAGALDNTLIVVVSDFGRTPIVNNSNGRDHWATGGAMLLGGGIEGSRVVGAADDNLRAIPVNTTTGQADASGEQLSAKHLGGSVVDLCLGNTFFSEKRSGYLYSIPALTQLKSS